MARGLIALSWALSLLSAVAGKKLAPCDGPRKFELTLTWEKHAPDGFEREMILTNGQFPGPPLELNQGDAVEVLVHNKMPYNTTVHWHGVPMTGTPWSDGVPGLTQRHIQPGKSFTYRFNADVPGSHWYHAHHRGQIDDGMYGAVVIHPKKGLQKPWNLISRDPADIRAMERAESNVKPILMSDWRHQTSDESWDTALAAGIEMICYDSILINGKGRVDCWDPEKSKSLLTEEQKMFLALGNETSMTAKGCLPASVLAVALGPGIPTNVSSIPPSVFDECHATNTPGEVIKVKKSCTSNATWVAFDVIATFGLMTGQFSIDETPMFVYAVDGDYIEPQLVQSIMMTNGDRYSVMLRLDKPGDYSIRFASIAAPQQIAGVATLSFDNAHGSNKTSTPYLNDVGAPLDPSLVVPFVQNTMKSFPPDSDFHSGPADSTFILSIRVAGKSYEWALNNTQYPMHLDNEEPLLFRNPPNRYINNNVTISTLNNTWVDLIFQAVTFPMPPHPMHKHGNKMWAIGAGEGVFNFSSVAEAVKVIPKNFNLVDPPKRDGLATPPAATGPAWLAVRYHVTNPGAWFLHCHIQSHMLGGMSMAIQDGVDQWPTVPEEYLNYR